MEQHFRRFAQYTAKYMGSPWAFIVAVASIVIWGISGPAFGFSTTWQLVINTSTTIITFLMVFLIQNTQNRDATAIQLKLDELIRGVSGARTRLVGLEELSDQELAELQEQFVRIRERTKGEVGEADVARIEHERGHRSTGDSANEATQKRRA